MPCINGMLAGGPAQNRIDEIAFQADRQQIPLNAMIELTYRCNIDCVHCYCQYLSNTHDREELTTAEWKGVLEELAELGAFHLALTGGEIFVRKDFWEIAHHAKQLRFSLTLFTNGTMIDAKRADLLAELRPTSIEMSLLGATEETHDRLTKMPGAWRRMMRATELLQERNLSFVFKTTLLTENFREQGAMEQVARAHGCRTYKRNAEVSPRNDGNNEPSRLQIDQQSMFEYYTDPQGGEAILPEEHVEREIALQKGTCGAGVNGCAVNPYGDFLPCIQLMIPFGNVRSNRLRDMWLNPPRELARVRQTKTYGQMEDCSVCDVIDYCTRCHGLADLESGRWDSCYSQARSTAEVVRAVVRYHKDGTHPDFHGESPVSRPRNDLVQIELGVAG